MNRGKVENFILKDQSGNDFELYKQLDKPVLLVFYPRDGSLICSRQLENYQQNMSVFEEAGIRPVGINIESIDSHNTFCRMKSIRFPLLSDADKSVSRRFGALNLFDVNKRKLVLINSLREIAYERIIPIYRYDSAVKCVNEINAYLNSHPAKLD
jgi:peroxiredoxin Q/BCP